MDSPTTNLAGYSAAMLLGCLPELLENSDEYCPHNYKTLQNLMMKLPSDNKMSQFSTVLATDSPATNN